MSLSNEIAQMLIELMGDTGSAEIQRNELANTLGCVPSQINYVISSRFTPERGFIVESRRGGGGFIKITRVNINGKEMIMHAVNSIGDEIDYLSCRAILLNLIQLKLISAGDYGILLAGLTDSALRPVPAVYRDAVRASIIKQTLLAVYNRKDD